MNSDLFLTHFNRISESPNAVSRMRRFILDLAVRGKLVKQDSREEPASMLLRRIGNEKARLINAGKIRNHHQNQPIQKEEQPFDLPASWAWTRFESIADFSAGRTPSRHDLTFWNTGDYPWVSIADMKDGGNVLITKETISTKAKNQVFGLEPAAIGTLIMSFKLTIGKISRLGVAAFHNEAIISIHPHMPEVEPYLFSVLPQFARQGNTKDAIKGATLNRESISNILIPVPPLSEQCRIIAKVKELMALCDRLEAANVNRDKNQQSFSATVHHHLSNRTETYSRHAAFFISNVTRLTSRPGQIKLLRGTILDLATKGRLVAQISTDEPASVLIKRVEKEIESYSTEQRISYRHPRNVDEASLQNPVPEGWIATRLSGLFRVITDGDHQPPPKESSGIAFLTIGNITTGSLDFSNCRFVSEAYMNGLAAYRKPSPGDILYTVVGATFGRCAFVDTTREFCVQRHIAILKPSQELDVQFLSFLLASPGVYKQAQSSATGTAQPTVPLRPLRDFIVLLPPLAEQRRIAAKVKELIALCDALETQIDAIQSDKSRLFQAVLHQALQTDG